jgi:anti-sigma regulatory factor (Ser/Thr protein kinase)
MTTTMAKTAADRQWVFTSKATDELPAEVRVRLDAFLRERRYVLRIPLRDDLIGDVLLAVSELLNNAIKYAPFEEVTTKAVFEPERSLWAGVWDPSSLEPRVTPIDDSALFNEGGRGLPIVMALANETNFTWTKGGGKWVWARFKI